MSQKAAGLRLKPQAEGQGAWFIDSHCHFDFAAFDLDRKSLWQSCARRNIFSLVIPGVEPLQWQRAENMCHDFPGIGFAVGLHPWWVAPYLTTFSTQDEACQALADEQARWLARPLCVALGECGLDKHIATPMDVQEAIFKAQVLTAKRAQKPLIIHSVKTHNPILKMLKECRVDSAGVIHAFSGSRQQALDFIDLGFFIGVGGTITYERAKKTRDAVKNIPLSHIVLETDAPDMPLMGRQGQRNTPESIVDIARVLSELRGVSIEEIAQTSSDNSMRLFGIKTASQMHNL